MTRRLLGKSAGISWQIGQFDILTGAQRPGDIELVGILHSSGLALGSFKPDVRNHYAPSPVMHLWFHRVHWMMRERCLKP